MKSMQRIFHLCFLSLVLLCLSAVNVSAVSVTASPTTALTGQTITATVRSEYLTTPACLLQINFGDTGTWQNLTPPCFTTPCTNTSSHSYTAQGTYQIRVQPDPTSPCVDLIPPTTAATTVTITAPPPTPTPTPTPTPVISEVDLPDGVVGMDYEYELGDIRNRYRKTIGIMDRGLKIKRNLLTGIPQREGKYRFRIRSTDPTGNTTDTWYNLRITRALLKVNVNPPRVTVDRNRAGSFRLQYTFSASKEINDLLESNIGIFLAGSRRLGSINKRVSAQMTRGRALFAEQVTIPLDVLKTAQRMGVDRIRYQRTFKARYMDAATTSSLAIAVGTGFTFTKIRIYFADDKSSKKFVKRNRKGITTAVDLRYEGAGLLKGYWQVDDRILARVTRNLPFANGRTITLNLPKVPPLPTHSFGSHRLRFVITQPVMRIPFPQVIYVVTSEDLSTSHPIHLINPVGGNSVRKDKLSFSWKPRHDVALYRLEILEGGEKNQTVVFSAFSKKAAYTIPKPVRVKKLKEGKKYSWRVTGLDRDNKPVALSRLEHFRLDPAGVIHVPGRLLMFIKNSDNRDNTPLLDGLIKKYSLTLLERKTLPQLGRELILVTTGEDVQQLSRKMAAENQDIMIQPDYFYSTLGEIIETQNREALLQFLHLGELAGGRGMRVAIIDTGVDLHHDDLAPNIVAHANYIRGSSYKGEIHGTAVAGIIGGVADGKGSAGIAPESGLIALRACEQVRPGKASGRCYTSSILQAIDRAMAETAGIINMSLGTAAPDNLVASALDTASDAGIILVAPVGNDPYLQKPVFPASHPEVISVAGVLDNGNKLPNSLVANKADCILPAQYILATLPGGRVSFMHGTSMASAEAAGLLADFHSSPTGIRHCRKQKNLIGCLAATKNSKHGQPQY